MEIQKISKALAGALVAGLVGYLADKNILIGDEVSNALNVLISALLGLVVVYLSPANKPK